MGTSVPDVPVPVSVLPEQSAGWLGTPGLCGHREGADFSSAFSVREVLFPAPRSLAVEAEDERAGLALRWELELTGSVLVRHRAVLTNHGRVLSVLGVQAPTLHPERLALIEVRRRTVPRA
ncbi:hypothetical protein ACFYOV_24965 [Streptomyces sp. NPDC005931]|uniref:hypothetical protein n=1 Tax=Streptomyces sp. NPDC005931 TaxID=3364737 RepID=UPI00367896E1